MFDIKTLLNRNPFDNILKKSLKKGHKNILLCWNRGIGDIPLGLYAVCKRIKHFIPNAKITFLIREDLKEAFYLFPHADFISVDFWKRGKKYSIRKTLKKLFLKNGFDLLIKYPDPTCWVSWQIGKVVPKLKWQNKFDNLFKKFSLDFGYVGVQLESDTSHSKFRDWPKENWEDLFSFLKEKKFVIFGKNKKETFLNKNVVDLRGKTTFLEVISIIKNRCSHVILPDGGILSTIFYLDENFPIKIISLWQDVQGVLKQNVLSPNKLCSHFPILGKKGDMKSIKKETFLKYLC